MPPKLLQKRGEKAQAQVASRLSKKKSKRQELEGTFAPEKWDVDIDIAKPKKKSRLTKSFEEAVKTHPYIDRIKYKGVIRGDYTGRDAAGNLLFVFLKGVIPPEVTKLAAQALHNAPATTDMRANVNGGVPPLSGIAGYYDYAGTPLPIKCRKTSFTYQQVAQWKKAFPFVEYVNEIYRRALPDKWELQNRAIPDPVRIRKSVFSTLTLNQRFRTAVHTDRGDFDHGFGCITVLDGEYQGCMLGFPASGLCVDVQPGDVLLFDTHCPHGNTEVEVENYSEWKRLSCVLYYRVNLGEPSCTQIYKERRAAMPRTRNIVRVNKNANLTNTNAETCYTPLELSFVSFMQGWASMMPRTQSVADTLATVEPAFNKLVGFREFSEGPLRVYMEPAEAQRLGVSLGTDRKYGGGFCITSPQFYAMSADVEEKATDSLSDREVLSQAFGDVLTKEWEDAKSMWTSEVKKEWSRVVKIRAVNQLSWKNTGALQDAFTRMCEVATVLYEVKFQVESLEEEHPARQEAWWLLFAGHLARSLLHEHQIPNTFVPLHKLNVKIRDFNFGGTRYSKDYDPEYRNGRLQQLRQATRPSTTAAEWVKDDSYDFQTEDEQVDYADIGVDPPSSCPAVQKIKPQGEQFMFVKQRPLKILVWREESLHNSTLPMPDTDMTDIFCQQYLAFSQTPDDDTLKEFDLFTGFPTENAEDPAETFDVICCLGVVSSISRTTLQKELRAAARLLSPDGILVVKDYNSRPFDHARLKPEVLHRQINDVSRLRSYLLGHDSNQRPLVTADEVISIAAPMFTNCCGIYQVPHSCLNEFFLAFAK
ncbi:base J-binding protein 1 A [Diplonema papillatum]|nr:base J-binding protein 1 A [Diplonema papillatum]